MDHDIGPLKKRRKKKRKGSSSSESSWNQPTKVKNNSSDDSKNLSPAKLTKSAPSEAEDQQPLNIDIDKIKQEILDSPNFRQVSHVSVPVVRTQTATVADSYLLQQQILPMNLATEQRGVEAALAKVSTSQASAFGTINSLRTPAIKNLTTKIMELSSPDAPVVNAAVPQISIKEEVVVEDYNTANIFCKKKRKAEQTKGFWVNSPTPATANSVSPAVLPSSPTVSNLIVTSSTRPPSSTETVTSDLMGPPAQASGISSHSAMIGTSGSLAQDIGTSGHTPRVVSRNMLQLRAKRIQLAAAEAAADLGGVVKDADLPENLGLPRERVISICNMDKHELDGYFLPGEIEEENSTDQDTAHELLQYFQMGDAEEKLKSLDDAKQRIPTSITNTTTTNKITTHILANERKRNITNKKQDVVMNVLPVVSKLRNDVDRNSNSSLNVTSSGIVSKLELPMGVAKSGDSASLEKQNVPAVGSASASLALMSKKHQQQQQEQQFKSNTNATNKGKGNATNALNIAPINKVNTPPTRKNCIFFPISPNINSVTSKCSSTTNNGIFASPDVVRLRPKPSFNKQNSLESTSGGSSDPMIGASRRRRIYNNNNLPSTSASAPPSPSLFQQQQQQHQFFCNQFSTAWQLPSTDVGFSEGPTKPVASNALLSEQNSLDLDLFGTTTGANTSFTNNSFNIDSGDYSLNGLSETQRSQSVPLSQLQRNHSPTFNRHNLHMNNYGTSHSVVQSTVPHDFADSTNLFSENSCSQHSGSMPPQLKLEEAAVLSSDSTAILRELEFNDMLSSPELVAKFSHIEHANTATTTCSSSGSSSGYSSGTCTKFTNGNISGGLESGIVSRSVPSTPLPYHCQNLFGSSGFYGRRREANSGNLDAHLSPIATSQAAASFHSSNAQTQFDRNFRNARLAYDISKSMPTTPITTPCFRYSPTDFNRDFLINGNTIDSISSSFGGMSNENMVNGNGEHIDVNILNSDALIENDADVSVDMLTANATDSIIVDTDLLANL